MRTPLKIERERRGLSAESLARAVGVKQPTINRIENGRKRPSPDLANRLAIYLEGAVSRDQIIFPEDYPAEVPKKAPVRAHLQKAS